MRPSDLLFRWEFETPHAALAFDVTVLGIGASEEKRAFDNAERRRKWKGR